MQAQVIETNLQPIPSLNLNSGYINRAAKLYLVKVIEHHVSKLHFLDYKCSLTIDWFFLKRTNTLFHNQ
jgi:hypothetical protein